MFKECVRPPSHHFPHVPRVPSGSTHSKMGHLQSLFFYGWIRQSLAKGPRCVCISFQRGDAIIARALGRLRAREREWAWWKLGMSQTPHIPRTLQLIRENPNEQRYKCANCANCAAVSKSDSASVVIAVRDCCCSNPCLLCLLLFFKITKSLPWAQNLGEGRF